MATRIVCDLCGHPVNQDAVVQLSYGKFPMPSESPAGMFNITRGGGRTSVTLVEQKFELKHIDLHKMCAKIWYERVSKMNLAESENAQAENTEGK